MDDYFGEIDDLQYTYNGNQLQRVNDLAGNVPETNDFPDHSNQTIEYNYDANGNMTRDYNKEIQEVQYNHLNLPKYVEVDGQDMIEINFTYDAAGIKLSKKAIVTGGSSITQTDYIGNFIYENGVLKRILHDEGVINVLSNNNYEYQFFIKDHLGNTRVVCKPAFNSNGTLKDKPTVLQRTDYYPFGMAHGGRDAQPLAESENKYCLFCLN